MRDHTRVRVILRLSHHAHVATTQSTTLRLFRRTRSCAFEPRHMRARSLCEGAAPNGLLVGENEKGERGPRARAGSRAHTHTLTRTCARVLTHTHARAHSRPCMHRRTHYKH